LDIGNAPAGLISSGDELHGAVMDFELIGPISGVERPRLRASRPSASYVALVPPKIRDLIAELRAAGFVNRGGKGSHRNFVHPKGSLRVTISGALGDDAQPYQIHAVEHAIEESKE
jgi:predicted RNA binding protein YcfA (HicA-like mRNA interferase family)